MWFLLICCFADDVGGVLCLGEIACIDFNSVACALYSCCLCDLIFRLCCRFVDCLVWYSWWLLWCCMILLCGFLYWLVVYLLCCLIIAGLSDLWCYCRFWLVALFVFSGWVASFAVGFRVWLGCCLLLYVWVCYLLFACCVGGLLLWVWFGCGDFGGLMYYKCPGFAGFRWYDFGVVLCFVQFRCWIDWISEGCVFVWFSAVFRWFGVVAWVAGLFVGYGGLLFWF